MKRKAAPQNNSSLSCLATGPSVITDSPKPPAPHQMQPQGQLTLQVAEDHVRQPGVICCGSMREIYGRKITGNKLPLPCFSQHDLILQLVMATEKHEWAFQA